MANRREFQFLYSKQPKLTLRTGLITFGGSGSVGTAAGPGLSSVTKLTTGIYQIKFIDNFYAYVGSQFSFNSGTSSTATTDGNFVANTLYQVVTVGTTLWTAIGLDSDYTAAAGMPFVASGTGGTGSGTARIIATAGTGLVHVEAVASVSAMLTNNYPNAPRGASLIIQTLAATSASVTTLIPSSPTAGSQVGFKVWFRDSSAPTS